MSKDRVSPSGPVSGVKPTSVTVALASLAAETGAAETVFAVPDASVGDVVTVNPQGSVGGGLRAFAQARVTTTGSVGVKYVNPGSASIAAATVSYDLYLSRR